MHNLHGSPVFLAIGTTKVPLVVRPTGQTIVGCALDKTRVASVTICADCDCSFVITRSTLMI